MKICSSKQDLLKGIQTAQSAISAKATLPILSNILIETKSGGLQLTATDLDIGISCFTPAKILEKGSITVPSKKIGEIVRELPEDDIIIEVKKNDTVVLTCGECMFRLIGLTADQFPKLPKLQDKQSLVLEQSTLKDMLVKTSFAMSFDETRYVLSGTLFIIDNNSITAVATDGRRLALVKKDLNQKIGFEKRIIIPHKTISELNKILSGGQDVKLIFGENQVLFQLQDVMIISRLIEGEFPKYQEVIPKQIKERMIINREGFLSGVKRASLLTSPESQSIKIDIFKDKMVISKVAPNIGEAKDEINIEYKGKEISTGFNPHYLIDVLRNIDQEEVVMELTGAETPGVIRTPDNYIYVVLPMQLT